MRTDGHGVESICDVLHLQGVQVAPRSYRAWKTRPAADRTINDATVVGKLRSLRQRDAKGRQKPEVLYGRRKMTAWLARNGFAGISKHTVDRVMRDEGMNGLVRGRKTRTTIPAKNGKRAGDLLNREFFAPYPNHSWVTDFTYVPTWAGFVYVAFAIDLYSRAIVGWQASTIKDTPFVEACLRMALWRRDHTSRPVNRGMIHHSDAGSQGGFNWSSQHLDRGGVRRWRRRTGLRRRVMCPWVHVGSGVRIGRCARRCVRLGGLSPRGRCSGSSGV
ncbi:DDE-type integrase/transposase/recombinase [Subtercola sp. RTI3]|uniref:DDE-type integrase/transposase/recombinase n=1 Tax=Subtercola sp. RTI3 TaxID=3048639 RepID=UPI003A598E5F